MKKKTKTKRKTTIKAKPKIAKSKQTGKTKSKKIDLDKHAQVPGRRVSRLGNVYYEYRKNRSDKNPKLGL